MSMKSLTKYELLKQAEDLHHDLVRLEAYTDVITDEQFEKLMDLAYLMRDYIRNNFHKTYHKVPGAKDLYSGNDGYVEIDVEIAEAVKIFNKKGYKTMASCAGHKPGDHGYVWIKPKPKAKLPKGLTFSDNSIRWAPKLPVDLELAHAALLRYAKNLRPLKVNK